MFTPLFYVPARYFMGLGVWTALLTVALVVLLNRRRTRKAAQKSVRLVNAGLSVWLGLGLVTLVEVAFAACSDTTDAFDMSNVSRRWKAMHVTPDLERLSFSGGQEMYYRDSRQLRDVQPGQRHICFVGDSFTFGHGVPDVEQRFTNRLRSMVPPTGETWEELVISNLSNPGTDLVWANTVIRELIGSSKRPDQVVYVMCLNDVEPFHPDYKQRVEEMNGLAQPSDNPLIRDTYFLNWIWYRSLQLSQPKLRNYYDHVRDDFRSDAWARFREMLFALHDDTQADGVELIVAIFPFLHNLGGNDQFDKAHEQIAGECTAHGIRVIDLKGDLAAHADERLTVNHFDAHPNERAHEIVAETLYRELLQHNSN